MAIESLGPWHVPGKWSACEHYWDDAVQSQLTMRPARVNIKEDTLREGEETPAVVFTPKDRVAIAKWLQDIGIAEIEMPNASSPEAQRELLKMMDDAGVTLPKSYIIGGTSRSWREGAERAKEFGADFVCLLFGFPQPPGFPVRGAATSASQIIEECQEAIEFCKSLGLKVAYGTPGTTRTSVATVVDFHSRAAKAGADRVHVYDSMGIGMPASIRYLVQSVKKAVGDTPLLFHCHNDLGMATANTIAGVEGGAEWVDVVANGLGDRAGNASLEEVVVALEMYGVQTGIDLGKIVEFSKFMEDLTGVKLQPNKAVVGRNAFLEEAAAHFLITKNAEKAGVPEAAAPYAPEVVGRTHALAIGTSSLYGGAIEYKLDEWGFQTTPEQVEAVRSEAAKQIEKKRMLTEDEFQAVCESVLGAKAAV